MINYDLIPKSMIAKGYCLKELGIFEYAWTLDDIENIIVILDKKKIPILGGDVYRIHNKKICSTYDSWYINLSDEIDFYNKSYEKAISYISDYEKKNEGKFIYSIVF